MSPFRVWIRAVPHWFFLVVLAFAALGAPCASASAPTISDAASCTALLPGATWSGTTCTIASAISITVSSEVDVAAGVALTNYGSLTVAATGAIGSGGVFTNLGTIVVDGGLANTSVVSGSPSMVNAGSIVVHGTLSNFCGGIPGAAIADCEFKNNGTITVSDGGFLSNACDQLADCNFANSGFIENAGDFIDECLQVDKCSSAGVFNDGHVHNAATGKIVIEWGVFFENGGFSGGTLDNDGEIDVVDAVGSILVANGSAAWQNRGSLNNHGTIFVGGAIFANEFEAVITNYGTITASPGAIGYLSNNGRIVETCGAVLTLVVFSGNPVDNECFDATATAISADSPTIPPSSTTPIAITATVSDTTTPFAFPPQNGNVLFSDHGAGGYFIGSIAEGEDPCNRLPDSTFRCDFSPLVPISGTASQLQVLYLPAPALGGSNLIPGSTITLSATYEGDAQHGSSTGSTTVAVLKDPRTLLLQLAAEVSGVGPGRSLSAKIAAALAYLAEGDMRSLDSVLTAFINEVNAQAGKTISASQAGQLVAAVEEIRELIP